jgi:hypothetical protein
MVNIVTVSLEYEFLVAFEGGDHSRAVRIVMLKLVHRRHFFAQKRPCKLGVNS